MSQIIKGVKSLKAGEATILFATLGSAFAETAAESQKNLQALKPPTGWAKDGVPGEDVWKEAREVALLLETEEEVGEYGDIVAQLNFLLVNMHSGTAVPEEEVQAYLAKLQAQETTAPAAESTTEPATEPTTAPAPEATTPVAETTVEAAKEIVAEAAQEGNPVAEQIQNLSPAQQDQAAVAFAQLTAVAAVAGEMIDYLAAQDESKVKLMRTLSAMLKTSPAEIAQKLNLAALPATAETTA